MTTVLSFHLLRSSHWSEMNSMGCALYIYISICPEQRPMHHGHGVLTQHGTTHISLDQVGSHIVNLLPLSETSGKLENDARISFDFVSQMY